MEINSEQQLNYVTALDAILTELIKSKDNGTVIGISALSMGPGMIMSAVEDIIDVRNDKIILLKDSDLLGIKLPESEILLSEIVKVYPLRTKYDDPFHEKLRALRNRTA